MRVCFIACLQEVGQEIFSEGPLEIHGWHHQVDEGRNFVNIVFVLCYVLAIDSYSIPELWIQNLLTERKVKENLLVECRGCLILGNVAHIDIFHQIKWIADGILKVTCVLGLVDFEDCSGIVLTTVVYFGHPR